MPIAGKDEQEMENISEILVEYQKSKDLELRNLLVMHYSYIAKTVAAQMRGVTSSYAQMEDIVNQGILTLIDCIEKFSPGKGVKFESYAFMRVKCANIDFVRKQDWLPRRVRKTAREVTTVYNQLSSELMREPTRREIAQRLGVSEETVDKHYSEISNSVMLSFEMLLQNSLMGAEGASNTFAGEDSQPETNLMRQELRRQLIDAIDHLTEKERLVISLYYNERLKFAEIAHVMGVSEARISQTHSKAVLKMRQKLEKYMKG